jgi:hypothetical protein
MGLLRGVGPVEPKFPALPNGTTDRTSADAGELNSPTTDAAVRHTNAMRLKMSFTEPPRRRLPAGRSRALYRLMG